MRPEAGTVKIPSVKIFFVTDLHGSEICWKKFLNAGSFYGADVVILGGDVTGKAMVPIVQRPNGTWEASLQDHRDTLESEDAIVEFEKRVMNRGYYPIRVSDQEYVAMQEDEDLVDKRFKEVMLDGTERWIAMAEEKLADTGIRVIACPANDDMFEIDDSSPARGSWRPATSPTRSSSATSRWSRWDGPIRRPGTRSGRRRNRRSRSGSTRRSRLRPTRRRRSSTSTRRPTGRSSTTRRP